MLNDDFETQASESSRAERGGQEAESRLDNSSTNKLFANSKAKTIGVMQPYFFPYIGYYQHVFACDQFVFLDDVDYSKLEYVGRNNLLVQKRKTPFGVEMSGGRSSNSLIKDLLLNPAPKWRAKMLKTIELNYKKTPHFHAVMDEIVSPVMLGAQTHVAELNRASIKACCEYLEIETTFVDTSVIYEKKNLFGSDRVRNICQLENATTYINSIGGKELYYHDEFAEDGLALKFLKPDMEAMVYSQGKSPWTPYLSILDVLMWNDRSRVQSFLSEYELVKGHASRTDRVAANV